MDDEDLCLHKYHRGLDRYWYCSLPASREHLTHFAHPCHNLETEPVAKWTGDILLGYRTSVGDVWFDTDESF